MLQDPQVRAIGDSRASLPVTRDTFYPANSFHDPKWVGLLSQVQFDFQPIVHVHTGETYGCEACLTNVHKLGFDSLSQMRDQAFLEGKLDIATLTIHEQALLRFHRSQYKDAFKLFLNLDARLVEQESGYIEALIEILQRFQLHPESICLEINGNLKLTETTQLNINHNHQKGFKILLDHCGKELHWLQNLYYLEPDFIKIDSDFLKQIPHYNKKGLFISNLLNIAHSVGALVISNNIDSEEELKVCREVGCELIQGEVLRQREFGITNLKAHYRAISPTNLLTGAGDGSGSGTGSASGDNLDSVNILNNIVEFVEPIKLKDSMFQVFKKFMTDKEKDFFPVINDHYEPIGIVRDIDFKEYIYSPFGWQLLRNPSIPNKLKDFIRRITIADVHTPAEKILELFSTNENSEGILIVDNMRYVGIISAQAFLKALVRKNYFNSLVENVPITMMMADINGKISYINPAGKSILSRLQAHLPFKTDEVIGKRWDCFYQDRPTIEKLRQASHQHTTVETQIGPETILVTTAPTYDSHGQYRGPMYSWDIVTELRMKEKEQREIQKQQQKQAARLAEQVLILTEIVQKVGEGTLSVEIPQFNDQTLDALSGGLRQMIASLRNAQEEEQRQHAKDKSMQKEVKVITDSVGRATETMSLTIQEIVHFTQDTTSKANMVLAEANEVNNRIDNVATSVEEMSVTSKEIAQNAIDSADISKSAVEESRKAHQIIMELGTTSEQVERITDIIHQIAEQTNLLALNATIEAASAGEAGKGFAVVAGEVKSLARQTAQATEDITTSLRDIQKDVEIAVESISGVSKIIGKMNEYTETISMATEQQSITANDIAALMSESVTSVDQVVQHIQGVVGAINETRQNTLKGEDAAQAMKNVVEKLQALIQNLNA